MQVERNVMFNKAGGTAGKDSVNYKLSLPAQMVKDLGITKDDRGVVLIFEDDKIIIKKR